MIPIRNFLLRLLAGKSTVLINAVLHLNEPVALNGRAYIASCGFIGSGVTEAAASRESDGA